jgi:hypothetical protein
VLIEATAFATQPVCNAAQAAHALRLDQKLSFCLQRFFYN